MYNLCGNLSIQPILRILEIIRQGSFLTVLLSGSGYTRISLETTGPSSPITTVLYLFWKTTTANRYRTSLSWKSQFTIHSHLKSIQPPSIKVQPLANPPSCHVGFGLLCVVAQCPDQGTPPTRMANITLSSSIAPGTPHDMDGHIFDLVAWFREHALGLNTICLILYHL